MLKIRLRRQGSQHAPFYRIVVSDSARTPRGNTLEEIGYYDPTKEPNAVQLDKERANYWIGKGAQVSPTVRSILKKAS